MYSGNSGSAQSSSGGDEEYDSHGPSMSNFLNSSPHFGSISSFPSPLSHQLPTPFDPHSQNFNSSFPDSTSSANKNNIDLILQRSLRSDPNFNNFGNITSSTVTDQPLYQGPYHDSTTTSIPAKSTIDQPKNPKKRSRASRRAPTTVLTTDTTNFRQMVQEFTGIPTSPFTGSPYSRRLDLFSTASSAMRSSAHLDPLFTLRPPAQKVQNSSPFMPSSSSSLLLSCSMIPTNISTVGITNASTSDVGIPKQAQNLFNMQNNDQIQSFNIPSLDELGIYGVVEQARKDNGGSSSQHVAAGGYKLNCSASEFHHDKGFENVCSAGEGTWTCPSG